MRSITRARNRDGHHIPPFEATFATGFDRHDRAGFLRTPSAAHLRPGPWARGVQPATADEGGVMTSAGGAVVTKAERERRTFEVLAGLLGWRTVPGSIQQPDPPDIVCEVDGLGALAVELVSLDADATHLRLANLSSSRRTWDVALARRAPQERASLSNELRDAYIRAYFANEAGSRDRSAAFHALQTFLLLRPGFTGDVPADDIGWPRGFHSAYVGRARLTNGPDVGAPSGDYWRPPEVERITRKLTGKVYQTTAPLELFAYSIFDEPDGAIGSLESIQAAVASAFPGSCFRRVHLFHLGFRQHLWSS
jgi:hypothetical protein